MKSLSRIVFCLAFVALAGCASMPAGQGAYVPVPVDEQVITHEAYGC